jgi:hypothetical protein
LPKTKRSFYATFDNSGIPSNCQDLSLTMVDSQFQNHIVRFFWHNGAFHAVGILTGQASRPGNSTITFYIGSTTKTINLAG